HPLPRAPRAPGAGGAGLPPAADGEAARRGAAGATGGGLREGGGAGRGMGTDAGGGGSALGVVGFDDLAERALEPRGVRRSELASVEDRPDLLGGRAGRRREVAAQPALQAEREAAGVQRLEELRRARRGGEAPGFGPAPEVVVGRLQGTLEIAAHGLDLV